MKIVKILVVSLFVFAVLGYVSVEAEEDEILIDEIETSLHPRVQRRLIRDLADIARLQDIQVVLTTHSPYVLEELPNEARVYIIDGIGGKQIITGVSPEFAMTKMDESIHPEIDVYVEDNIVPIVAIVAPRC